MNDALDVAKFIDQRGVGGFQILVLGLCFIVMTIDGFDAQAVGFVAPLISTEWGVAKASFGPVFAAGLLGMALGALLLLAALFVLLVGFVTSTHAALRLRLQSAGK